MAEVLVKNACVRCGEPVTDNRAVLVGDVRLTARASHRSTEPEADQRRVNFYRGGRRGVYHIDCWHLYAVSLVSPE